MCHMLGCEPGHRIINQWSLNLINVLYMKKVDFIKNAKQVIDCFGYWPTFHDDIILAFEVDTIPLSIKLKIESCAKRPGSDDKCFIITLVLRGVIKLDLNSNAENIASVIFDMSFKKNDDCTEVNMDSSTGFCFQAICKEVVVVDVESVNKSNSDSLKSKNW